MGIKHLAVDGLSRVETEGKDHTPQKVEVLVLPIVPRSLACAPITVEDDLETIAVPKGPIPAIY